ncbi:Nucleotidyl transferase AbiEii toxin, Type IV TA system [Sanguibacter gelidistatuariae]|uniref:Nucleotidyl transferase AbiEii toxin, Type IV TA system n=2 Tax=Sanguibacter gelidistatuariae TaxID=1814289 RepID=A0A1G6H5S5_9MICO|nr:Nucleotidyl transferase AbiEii toxin, Type IV TA system [Sanguibacter gelidistatuariae]
MGDPAERLAWLVASTVVVAVLQRTLDSTGHPRFLLKGGTLLQHRLGLSSRATKDVDGLVRGDIDEFIICLDDVLTEPWGPLTVRRTGVETIDTPFKVIKPRRFNVIVELKGKTWRKVQVEIAPDEGHAGRESELVTPPTLAPFGLDGPQTLAGLTMRYQVAQKIHACTDPHNPPASKNDRARDVVDLLLLRGLDGIGDDPAGVRKAVVDIFSARAAEARELGNPERTWPCTALAHEHWTIDYARAARGTDVTPTLGEAVAELNKWLAEIDAAAHTGGPPLG